MRLFARKDRSPLEPLPLRRPRLDGTGWPDPAALGRPSFESATYYEMATRRAYEPQAHAVADALVAAALPRVVTGATAEDEPYLDKVLLVAARIGAGLGIVDREQVAAGPDVLDRDVARALEQAQRGLPTMREDWTRIAGWFLLAGHLLAREGPDVLPELLDGLEPP